MIYCFLSFSKLTILYIFFESSGDRSDNSCIDLMNQLWKFQICNMILTSFCVVGIDYLVLASLQLGTIFNPSSAMRNPTKLTIFSLKLYLLISTTSLSSWSICSIFLIYSWCSSLVPVVPIKMSSMLQTVWMIYWLRNGQRILFIHCWNILEALLIQMA
jgi:hypothetical protein